MYTIPYHHIPYHLRITNRHLIAPKADLEAAKSGAPYLNQKDLVEEGEVASRDEAEEPTTQASSASQGFTAQTPEEKILLHQIEEMIKDT